MKSHILAAMTALLATASSTNASTTTCNTNNKPFTKSAAIEACNTISKNFPSGNLAIDSSSEQTFLATPPSDPRIAVLLNRFCREDSHCVAYSGPVQDAVDECLALVQACAGDGVETLNGGAKIDTGDDFGAGAGGSSVTVSIS